MNTWNTARRILAVRLDTMGDVLMTTPAIRALRAAGPEDRTISLLTSSRGADVVPFVPQVDDVIIYDPPWMKIPLAGRTPTADLAMIDHLRARAYDAAVIFTAYSQSPLPAALTCYLAGIPLRLAHSHENPYELLTDWVPETEPQEQIRHEVRRQLHLVATVGVSARDGPLVFDLPPDTGAEAIALLAAHGVDSDRPWIAVHPGASAPSRRYPVSLYAEALHELVHTDGLQAVVTGGPDDIALVEDLVTRVGDGAVGLAGATALGMLAGVISHCALLLSNNTGPVHIAAALAVPVVDLYALTNPQHMPWSVPSRVLSNDVPCRWCYKSVCPMLHHLCLRGVHPDEVVAAVRELLHENAH